MFGHGVATPHSRDLQEMIILEADRLRLVFNTVADAEKWTPALMDIFKHDSYVIRQGQGNNQFTVDIVGPYLETVVDVASALSLSHAMAEGYTLLAQEDAAAAKLHVQSLTAQLTAPPPVYPMQYHQEHGMLVIDMQDVNLAAHVRAQLQQRISTHPLGSPFSRLQVDEAAAVLCPDTTVVIHGEIEPAMNLLMTATNEKGRNILNPHQYSDLLQAAKAHDEQARAGQVEAVLGGC